MNEAKFPGKRLWAIAVCIILAVAMVLAWFWAGVPRENDGFTPEAIVTFHLASVISFDCELADSEAEMAVGLMHRESLDLGRGMLFKFEASRNVTFWMKNTLIPLDMVFIDEGLTVVNIEEAVPEPGVPDGNLTLYRSERPVKWVLEVNMGICRSSGIVSGTRVSIEFPTQ